jgi:hypothetical protein
MMRFTIFFTLLFFALSAQAADLKHNPETKTILIANDSELLQIRIEYGKGCKIGQVIIKGQNTISPAGVFTSIQTGTGISTSLESTKKAKVKVGENRVEVSNIVFGNDQMKVKETWLFTWSHDRIYWDIEREYRQAGSLENMAMPVWNFSSLSTWKGGILNTGGMVWCKYLKEPGDTYGVHTNGVTFWEPASGDGLRIEANSGSGGSIASAFSHGEQGEFTFTQYLTPSELGQRYNLNRFVNGKADVFSPFEVEKGSSRISLELSYVDYAEKYDRGTLVGIDAIAVRELLNTTGRYGVIDKNIIGANGWITNWKCLHEPFFAQIGMAVNDRYYTDNFSATLDQERDQAIEEDGRVLARWHNVPEAQNSNYNFETGYYDCPWGYTIDAQPGQIINTVEQFHQNGDLAWLQSHKQSCEKVLNWLINRDSNNNGIFEMLNDNSEEGVCSDWIDVVWASFENAFVNAQMYEALNLWADCELVLGDKEKADYYSQVAARLKESFNKTVEEGGFWSEEKKQYIYWRDKDGSLHGDNLVTPVNFAAIAFGICDDSRRVKAVLDQIEDKSKAENLFHWPLCFESFKLEEVHAPVNWPFPNYENGDIFPTWGYMGIRSYVKYDKEIALKYIKNILRQYNKDGLSSQRFARETQEGIGHDILAGSATTITALYRDIYGIRPMWNRMGLEPHMLKELNGTEFKYTLRDEVYNIKLSENSYQLSTADFTLDNTLAFGVNMMDSTLHYYPGNQQSEELSVTRKDEQVIKIEIGEWSDKRNWILHSRGEYHFVLAGLKPHSAYTLTVNGNEKQSYSASASGIVSFEYQCDVPTSFSISE